MTHGTNTTHPHKSEMNRYINSKYGTAVWCKNPESDNWEKTGTPAWREDMLYVIDDKWASLRKSQYDGHQLQYYGGPVLGWIDWRLSNLDISRPEDWRVKPAEIETVQYIVQINDEFVVSEPFETKEEAIANLPEEAQIMSEIQDSKTIKEDNTKDETDMNDIEMDEKRSLFDEKLDKMIKAKGKS